MRRAAALLALLLATAAPRARGEQPLQPLYGRTIATLRFAGDAPEDEAALAAVTDLRPGQTLTEAAVRTAMRNLFATRKLSDLAIEAAPAGDRVVVLVRYSAAPRIARVTLVGARLAERLRLRDALSLEVGETWSAERGETAERGVRRVLRERGWFEPEVTTRVDPGPDETSVAITVTIRSGPRALTAPPLFTGSVEPFTTALLSRRAKLREGAVFRPSRAREGAERISS